VNNPIYKAGQHLSRYEPKVIYDDEKPPGDLDLLPYGGGYLVLNFVEGVPEKSCGYGFYNLLTPNGEVLLVFEPTVHDEWEVVK